jgi:hypothetical protein
MAKIVIIFKENSLGHNQSISYGQGLFISVAYGLVFSFRNTV